MNNVKEATREQEFAAEFLAGWFDRVLVGTPNAHGNLQMTAYNGDVSTCSWIVRPDGELIYKHYRHIDARKATMAYLLELSEKT